MRMQETGLWVVLVAWAAESVSLFDGQDLGGDSTFLPHGTNHADLQSTQHGRVNHLKFNTCSLHSSDSPSTETGLVITPASSEAPIQKHADVSASCLVDVNKLTHLNV